jgi:hypothetical protein
MSKRKEIPDVMSQLQGLAPAPAAPTEPVLSRPTLSPPPTLEASLQPPGKNRTPKSRLIGRATYDIGQDLKDALQQESVDLGVPASQLAKYLLLYAWDYYSRGEIPPPTLLRSDSPKFRNTIDFG